MEFVQPFLNPGQCCMPDCEVTLKFDQDETNLYVCKHALVNLSDYFKTMFFGGFMEKNKNEIEIHGVSRSEMLLFLQFALPVEKVEAPKPADLTQLCSLISLADCFLYPKLRQVIAARLPQWTLSWIPTEAELVHLIALGDILVHCDLNQVIIKHILFKRENFNWDSNVKLALVETAYQHQGRSTAILECCIRLCANMEMGEVSQLQGKTTNGIMVAIYDVIAKAMPKFAHAPEHFHSSKGNRLDPQVYDRFRVTSDHRWWWSCSKCIREEEATMPFEKIIQLPIDKSLLTKTDNT